MKPKCAFCRWSCYSFAVKSFVCYLHSQEPEIVDEHYSCIAFSDVVDEVIVDDEEKPL